MPRDSQPLIHPFRVLFKPLRWLAALGLLSTLPLATQNLAAQQQSTLSSDSSQGPPTKPASVKPPTLIDQTGPDISLQSSEALFDIAAALNSCGYDQGLAESNPVRLRVRQQINQALQGSAKARDVHDQICTFIDQHQLSGSGTDLAQYISLALYSTPPPNLAPAVDDSDMPPDATQVEGILPLVRSFADLINLHLIWVGVRPEYDREMNALHESLSTMIIDTNAYLKMPVSSYSGERFLVVMEPLLDPAQTNARIYGANYVVVVSPVNGAIRMDEVRHTYLHYDIEPLLYARASALDRLLPFLKVVRDAPLDYTYRSDIVSLVVECMIRAIEARTMDTGVAIYKIPDDVRRSDLEAETRKHNDSVEHAEAVRRAKVQQSMLQGFVLTEYFYNAFVAFEKQPQSFKESIGEMVYGMDVGSEVGRVKHIAFADQAPDDVVQRAAQKPRGLDLAELDLMKGDNNDAGALAQRVLADRSGDAARANFILARVAIMHSDVPGAEHDFAETIRLSTDPRMLAWSHIYLGRIYDVEDQRDQAVNEYKEALTVRDGQPDTKRAAEKGIAKPYAIPHQAVDEPAGGPAPESAGQKPSAQEQSNPPQPSPPQS